MATDYTKILPQGEENAISTAHLVAIMGFHSKRSLQKDIEASRAAGQIILSSTRGGYYLPANRQEIQRFVRTCEAKAKGTFKALRSAREALRQMEGQITMTGAEEKPHV